MHATRVRSIRTNKAQPRFAIYYAPVGEASLWQFGSALIGRDAANDAPTLHSVLPGWDRRELHRVTAEPRRYGFHATLKAPFRLAPGVHIDELVTELAAFAAARNAFVLPRLQLSELGSFLALCPVEVPPALPQLVDECVVAFERFRAPLTQSERERRLRGGLNPRQRELLERWGYPYVMDEYRFHMTLTGALETAARESLKCALAPAVSSLCRTGTMFDAVCLFTQAHPDSAFVLRQRFPLAGA